MPFAVAVENAAVAKGLSEAMARKALAERSEMLHEVFTQAGTELDPAKVTQQTFKDGAEMATWIKNVNDELSYIGERVTEFDVLAKIRTENDERLAKQREYVKDPSPFAPGDGKGKRPEFKNMGRVMAEFEGLMKAAKAGGASKYTIEDFDAKAWLEAKANFVTTAGWAPESTRTGRVVMDEQRGIEVADILPLFPTSLAAIIYMEETTFTNNAAERAEAGAYAESAFALTQRSVPVQSVGTSLPVSDEQLEDEAGVAAYLDQRLGFAVRQRLDSQILVGNGTPPNLMGTNNVAGIQTQALGGDTVPDAVYKALDLVLVTGRAQPNVIISHPTDWQPVRLMKTVDGIYIWGSPSDAGPARMWGYPVLLTTAQTPNTMIVGDYARYSGLHVRRGLEVQSGYVADNFKNGMVTLRAGMRVAVVHYRPTAFCTVTGV
jgi:HK97 family phage major capsid protein